MLRCVRCGVEPRHMSSFLCKWCHADAGTETEWRDAEKHGGRTDTERRDYLVRRWTWAGGWRKRAKAA